MIQRVLSGKIHRWLTQFPAVGLLGHPTYGSSWEGYVVEQILGQIGVEWEAAFYRTSAGAECDLVLRRGRRLLAVECKAATAPEPTRGFWNTLEDVKPEHAWIVAPVEAAYLIRWDVTVTSLAALLGHLEGQN